MSLFSVLGRVLQICRHCEKYFANKEKNVVDGDFYCQLLLTSARYKWSYVCDSALISALIIYLRDLGWILNVLFFLPVNDVVLLDFASRLHVASYTYLPTLKAIEAYDLFPICGFNC